MSSCSPTRLVYETRESSDMVTEIYFTDGRQRFQRRFPIWHQGLSGWLMVHRAGPQTTLHSLHQSWNFWNLMEYFRGESRWGRWGKVIYYLFKRKYRKEDVPTFKDVFFPLRILTSNVLEELRHSGAITVWWRTQEIQSLSTTNLVLQLFLHYFQPHDKWQTAKASVIFTPVVVSKPKHGGHAMSCIGWSWTAWLWCLGFEKQLLQKQEQ